MRALEGETAFPYRLHLEQAQVTPIILERLRAYRHARVLFDAEVQHVAQQGSRVVVRVRHGAGHETLDGDYLIAADGSRSDVRAALGIDFEGEDYPDKILRVMTTDDLDALLPGIAPVTYLWNGMQVGELPAHARLLADHPARAEGSRRRAGARSPIGSSRACAR